jgi:hypothetical protein
MKKTHRAGFIVAASIAQLAWPLPKAMASDAPPSIVVEVKSPKKLLHLFENDPWLKEVGGSPLGRGLLGSWGAFLFSKGEDLKATFSGTVMQLIAERMLDAPFSIAWFGGRASTGAPSIVALDPSEGAKDAFDLLDRWANKGVLTVSRCKLDGVAFHRWLVADHPLFAARSGDRIVLGKTPATVENGLCATKADLTSRGDDDLEVALFPERMGQETERFVHALGLAERGRPRFGFSIEKDRLVPRGIEAELVRDARLTSGALEPSMIGAIPADVPIVLAFQILLPKRLSAQAVERSFARSTGSRSDLEARQIVLLWTPHGDSNVENDLALLWSRPSDAKALAAMFSGKNALQLKEACGHVVLASNGEMMSRIEGACGKKLPSMANAAPKVVSGFSAPSSIVLGVNLGRCLSGVLLDAYRAEHGAGAPPREIAHAIGDLEALPFIGLSGKREEARLVPGGFRS